MYNRKNIGMVAAELLGTFMLASVVLSAASYFTFTAPWYVAISYGVAIATLVATIGAVSGAHVNPAITIGLWTLRKVTTVRALVYIAAQMLGGALALVFIEYLTNIESAATGAGSFDMRVYVAELVGAAIFGFGFAAYVMQRIDNAYAAFTIGGSLFIGVIIASLAAPGFVNPAVALAHNAWSWTVVTAPILGAVLGMNLYSMLFAPTASLRVSRTVKRK